MQVHKRDDQRETGHSEILCRSLGAWANKKLVEVRPLTNELIFLSYETSAGSISTFLGFDGKTGKIEWQRCGPEIPAAKPG